MVDVYLLLTSILPMLIIVNYNKYLIRKYGKDDYKYHDFMNYVFYEIFGRRFGFWSLSHFICFFIASSIPGRKIACKCLLIGILWEIIEDLLSKYVKKKDITKKHYRRKWNGNDDDIVYTDWWSGSMEDIIVNTSGFMLGYMIRTYMPVTFYVIILSLVMGLYSAGLGFMAKKVDTPIPYVLLGICLIISVLIYMFSKNNWNSYQKKLVFISLVLPLSIVLLSKKMPKFVEK